MRRFDATGSALAVVPVLLVAACADLVVTDLPYSPGCPTTATPIEFSADVKNIGYWNSGASTLAFKVGGETTPGPFAVPALAPGATHRVTRQELLNVAQNYQNTVTADANDDVTEISENNNEKKLFYTVAPVPDTSGLTNHVYNESLATVLRGVLIEPAAGQALNIAPGYYRIREFRVWTQPNERVNTLSIEKNYAEMAIGQSILPKRDEPWVFSIIETDDYAGARRVYNAQDFHGHRFSYEIEWDSTAGCWNVVSAGLDCAQVGLSTQGYGGGALSTCGWTSEPPWTLP